MKPAICGSGRPAKRTVSPSERPSATAALRPSSTPVESSALRSTPSITSYIPWPLGSMPYPTSATAPSSLGAYSEVASTAPASATSGCARTDRTSCVTSASVASVSNGRVPLGATRIWNPRLRRSRSNERSSPPARRTMSSSSADATATPTTASPVRRGRRATLRTPNRRLIPAPKGPSDGCG